MNFNCKLEVKTVEGKTMRYPDGAVVYARGVVLDALSLRLPCDQGSHRDGKKSRELYALARKLGAADTVDVTRSDIETMRTRINQHPEHSHLVIGFMLDYLDQLSAEAPKLGVAGT